MTTRTAPMPARRRRDWVPDTAGISIDPNAGDRLESFLRLALANLIQTIGNASSTARLLDVNRAQITRWQNNDPISGEMARRILDLNDVLHRALRQFSPRMVPQWLLGSEPHLGGARPIDVLALRGAAPIIAALDAIEDGAYA